jgi:uncharacterized FlaG/YvyC family protein
MSVQFGHLRLVEPSAGISAYTPHPAGTAATAHSTPADSSDVIPATPPDEVRDAVGEAFARVHEMYDDNRELHFAKDPVTNRIIVQVRELDGTVVRTIPPSEALDVMSGLATA